MSSIRWVNEASHFHMCDAHLVAGHNILEGLPQLHYSRSKRRRKSNIASTVQILSTGTRL